MGMGDVGGKEVKRQGGERWQDSRKVGVTLLGITAVLILAIVAIIQGADKDQISSLSGFATAIAGIVAGYVVGQGYADGQATKAK